jgi:Cytochrome c554 and c-prime
VFGSNDGGDPMKNKIVRNKLLPFLFLLVSIITILIVASKANSQQTNPSDQKEMTGSNEYVGSEQCAACHEDKVTSLQHTVHDTKAFHERSDKGCEECHGPGKAHVESGGDVTLIRTFKNLDARASAAVCLTCHEKGQQTHWKGSTHEM